MKLQSRQFLFKSLLIILLALIFSIAIFAQDETEIKLPDQIMEEIVNRILVYSFKPRNKPTTIYLAEKGIKESWLPNIKNIEFKLLSDKEIEKKDIYFFKLFDKEKKNFSIGFGFGDPNCSSYGLNWSFRIVKEKVKLWQSGQFATNCGANGGFGTITSP